MKLFPRLSLLILLCMFSTLAKPAHAQQPLATSETTFADGRRLTTALFNRTGTQADPFDAYLKLDGIPGETGTISRTVFVQGTGQGGVTSPATIATVIMAGYAVLTGRATPRYASIVAQASSQVLVTFEVSGPDQPVVIGSLFDDQGLTEIANGQAILVGGPRAEATGQFGLPSACAALPGAPCNNIAPQLDADGNGNLLVRVFQGSGVAPAGLTVTVCLNGALELSALTDSSGVASFNGPDNTITLNSQNSITGVSVQLLNGGTVATCTLLGSPCSVT